MKKTLLFATVALATAVVSPAFAQQQYRAQDSARNPYNAYAAPYANSYIRPEDNRRHSPNPAWDVYDTTGHYIGSDPDPTIRDSMLRESRGEY